MTVISQVQTALVLHEWQQLVALLLRPYRQSADVSLGRICRSLMVSS